MRASVRALATGAGAVAVAVAVAVAGVAGPAAAHEGPVPDAGAPFAADAADAADDGPITGPGGRWIPSTPAGYETVFGVVRAAAPEALPPRLGGRWSDVYGWPLVAVHAALLPNGKVIAWDATPDDADEDPHTSDDYTTRTTLWDPATNVHVQTYNDTDTDLFCAGAAHLWDGRLLFAGGDGGRRGGNAPLSNTNLYDWHTNTWRPNTWRREADMAAPRRYASVAALGNGEMLTLEGSYAPGPVAEVFGHDRAWRPLDVRDVRRARATDEGLGEVALGDGVHDDAVPDASAGALGGESGTVRTGGGAAGLALIALPGTVGLARRRRRTPASENGPGGEEGKR